jgi:CheY-like chemotaxis protein
MKPRLLIVDDDEVVTQQLYWTLCDDYDVITAKDMQSAVRRVTIYEPELAILDLHLPPAVNSPDVGLRILEFIKAHIPEAKVLVISASENIETQEACRAGGADGFLDKPFETEQLLAAMRRIAPQRPLDGA